jgi:hypothetical protein
MQIHHHYCRKSTGPKGRRDPNSTAKYTGTYQPDIPVPFITTREEQTSARHRECTPKYSYPAAASTKRISSPVRDRDVNSVKRKLHQSSPAYSIPSTVKEYTPAVLRTRKGPQMRTFTAQQRLDDDLAETAMNTEAIKSPTTDVVKQK